MVEEEKWDGKDESVWKQYKKIQNKYYNIYIQNVQVYINTGSE